MSATSPLKTNPTSALKRGFPSHIANFIINDLSRVRNQLGDAAFLTGQKLNELREKLMDVWAGDLSKKELIDWYWQQTGFDPRKKKK